MQTKQSKKHHKNDSMSEQIKDLISMLVKKLATVVSLRMSRQYSCQVRDTDFKTEDLI